MKYIKGLSAILIFVFLIIISGCDKTDLYKTITPPEQAHFTNLTVGTYYVKNDPSTVYKIPVGLTKVSDKDVTVTVSVTSPTGAVAGTQYRLPSTSVTIPAGKIIDSLSVNGIFDGFSGSGNRIDTLIFTIQSGDAPASDYNNVYKLILRKYCDVILSDFVGDYNNSFDTQAGSPDYGPYFQNFSNPVVLTATTGTIQIDNFWDVGGPLLTVKLDWTDPANFKTTIPAQPLYTDATYGPATITGVSTGSFSSCDNTFTFSYTVTVAAGSFGNYITTVAR